MLIQFLFVFSFVGCVFFRDEDCESFYIDSRRYEGKAVGGDCYYFGGSTNQKTWEEAQSVCDEMGGNLVSIQDLIQNDVVSTVSRLADIIWIGLNDRENEGKWKWSDGSDVFFTKWGPGEPNNAHDNENCAEMVVSTTYSYWNDISCTSTRSFTCRVDGQGETYFFENENFDTVDGEFGVAEETYCCEHMEDCGFRNDDITSLFVPRDHVLVLFNEGECKSGSYDYTLVQGPVNIANLGANLNDFVSSYRLEPKDLADYPSVYAEEDYKNFAFYISGYCKSIASCFYYKADYNDAIRSVKIPAGWMVEFYEDREYGGMKLTLNGPKNIPDLREYHSFFDSTISSFKLKPASSAALVIEEIFFDQAQQIGDLDYDILESVTIDNPTSNPQEYTMSKTYSQTQETNYFSSKSMTKSYNYEVGVTAEVEGKGILGGAKAGTSFSHSWGGSSSYSSGEGGSSSYTEEKTYNFVCSASENTRTTCDITQTHGTYNIPYRGKLIFEYEDGKKGERYWDGIIDTVVRGQAFLQFEEEDLVCPSGNERGGYCYDVIDGNTYTFDEAMAECYFTGKTVAHPRDQSENQFIHELCDYRSIWLKGYVKSDGYPSWEDSDYVRYEESIDESKFGNNQYYLFVPEHDDNLGYWILEDKEQPFANCVVCMWECNRS